jgi:hypothetical protein
MQAADLKYIMEAPKLELSPDEKVQIPVLTGMEANRGARTAAVVRPRMGGGAARRVPKSWDEEFWDNYRWVAGLAGWLVGWGDYQCLGWVAG